MDIDFVCLPISDQHDEEVAKIDRRNFVCLPISDQHEEEGESKGGRREERRGRRGDGKDGWLYMPQREKELKERQRSEGGGKLDSD